MNEITLEQIARRLKLESFSDMYNRIKHLEYGPTCDWINLPYDCVVFKHVDGMLTKTKFLKLVPDFPATQFFIWRSEYIVVQENFATILETSNNNFIMYNG